MFGSGQRGARHRAPVVASTAPATEQPHKAHAGPTRAPWWATGLAFLAILGLLFAGWKAFGQLGQKPTPGAGAGARPAAASSPAPTTAAASAGTPGARTTVTIGPNGGLHAQMILTFGSKRSRIAFSVPSRPGVGTQFLPLVENIRVTANGKTHALTQSLFSGDAASFRLSSPARLVTVRYLVRDAVSRSAPSAPGRALALATPLVVGHVGRLSASVQVGSRHVLNIGCISRNGTLATCGTQTAKGWKVVAAAGQPTPDVVAQVNLPNG
jgi:hypothetical protein